MKSRREALRSLAVGALAPALHAQTAQHQHVAEPLVQLVTAPKYISADDFKLLATVVDVIIPPTDTPGASAAGVPLFIFPLSKRIRFPKKSSLSTRKRPDSFPV